MNLTQQQKRLLRWLGGPLLAIVTFLYTLHLTFPYERAKDKLIEQAGDKYEISVVAVDRALWPGSFSLDTVVVQNRPSKPDEPPTAVLIDKLHVDLGLLGLLRQRADVDVVAEIGGGSIDASLQLAASEMVLNVATQALPLQSIPGLPAAVGLPMRGGLDAEIDLTVPEQRWDRAQGQIGLRCPGCTVGDGQAKLKPPTTSSRRRRSSAVFASEGVTVPELQLGNLIGNIKIENGRATIEQLGAQSADGELQVHGAIKFNRNIKNAEFERGCLKFKLTDDLKKREPSFGNFPMLMGSPIDGDGFTNLMMLGKLTTMRMRAATNCESDGSSERVSSTRGRPSRPTISPRPDRNQTTPGQNGGRAAAAADKSEAGKSGASQTAARADSRPDSSDDNGDDKADRSADKARASSTAMRAAARRMRGDDVRGRVTTRPASADEGEEDDDGDEGDDDDDDDDDDEDEDGDDDDRDEDEEGDEDDEGDQDEE